MSAVLAQMIDERDAALKRASVAEEALAVAGAVCHQVTAYRGVRHRSNDMPPIAMDRLIKLHNNWLRVTGHTVDAHVLAPPPRVQGREVGG